jgi:acetylornithine/N-succinyldiaminopimelate aminotransferase
VLSQPAFLASVRAGGAEVAEGLAILARRYDAKFRGRGLLWALELAGPTAEHVRDRCLTAGLLVNAPRANSIRLMPSLRVSRAEIDEMLRILDGALSVS